MRRKLVVLEGPDCSGKTTLANMLVDRLGFRYQHEGPPPAGRDAFEYYRQRLTMAHLWTFASPGVVLDRFALGERVYGPLLRGTDSLGARGWAAMRGLLDHCGALRVLCLPPLEVALEGWRRRKVAGGELVPDETRFLATYNAWAGFSNDRGQLLHDWCDPTSVGRVWKAVTGRRAA